MIAVTLNAVVDTKLSFAKITMNAQMIIAPPMMDVNIMILNVMIRMYVLLIPVVKKKVVNMFLSAAMITMLVHMILAIK